ncbi:CYFA0S04e00584g1_1 [Hexamita inflata]|uniref:CYFA0S04e00584g1_1 n=1 Tax=Hexamita inflata TaxID=28002 RepID=A0AA86P1S9_9EUKA|nr:CYFA0S04e00584g1_1 [Hexamita inflata]
MNSRQYYLTTNWSQQEDDILKQAVQKYGLNNWQSVQTLLPYKTMQQCKNRFNSYSNKKLSDEQVISVLKQTNMQIHQAAVLLNVNDEYVQEIYIKYENTKANITGNVTVTDITNKIEQQRMKQEIEARLSGQTSKFARKHQLKIKQEIITDKSNETIIWAGLDNAINAALDKIKEQLLNMDLIKDLD